MLRDAPVHLESQLPPFYGYDLSPLRAEPTISDDGRRSTFLSRAVDSLRIDSKNENTALVANSAYQPTSSWYTDTQNLIEIALVVPKHLDVPAETSARLLTALSNTQHPISFEVLCNGEEITMSFVARESDAEKVKRQLNGFFPEIALDENENRLSEIIVEKVVNENQPYAAVDYGLSEEFVFSACVDFTVFA